MHFSLLFLHMCTLNNTSQDCRLQTGLGKYIIIIFFLIAFSFVVLFTFHCLINSNFLARLRYLYLFGYAIALYAQKNIVKIFSLFFWATFLGVGVYCGIATLLYLSSFIQNNIYCNYLTKIYCFVTFI